MKCKIKNIWGHQSHPIGDNYKKEIHGNYGNARNRREGIILETDGDFYLVEVLESKANNGKNLVLWYPKSEIDPLETNLEIILW